MAPTKGAFRVPYPDEDEDMEMFGEGGDELDAGSPRSEATALPMTQPVPMMQAVGQAMRGYVQPSFSAPMTNEVGLPATPPMSTGPVGVGSPEANQVGYTGDTRILPRPDGSVPNPGDPNAYGVRGISSGVLPRPDGSAPDLADPNVYGTRGTAPGYQAPPAAAQAGPAINTGEANPYVQYSPLWFAHEKEKDLRKLEDRRLANAGTLAVQESQNKALADTTAAKVAADKDIASANRDTATRGQDLESRARSEGIAVQREQIAATAGHQREYLAHLRDQAARELALRELTIFNEIRSRRRRPGFSTPTSARFRR